MTKLLSREPYWWLLGVREKVEECVTEKDNMKDPCGDGNILYLDCVNVNILVVIMYYTSIICCHWK